MQKQSVAARLEQHGGQNEARYSILALQAFPFFSFDWPFHGSLLRREGILSKASLVLEASSISMHNLALNPSASS